MVDTVASGDGVAESVDALLSEPLLVGVGELLAVPLLVPLALNVVDAVAVTVTDAVADGVAVGEELAVRVSVPLPLPVGEADAVGDGVSAALGDGVAAGVDELDGVPLLDGVIAPLPLPVGEADTVCVALGESVDAALPVLLPVPLSVAVGVCVPLTVDALLPVPLCVGEGVCVPLPVPLPLTVGELVWLAVRDGVGVCDGVEDGVCEEVGDMDASGHVIVRIVWDAVSATKMVPAASTATPRGLLNVADEPSANPRAAGPPPMIVVVSVPVPPVLVLTSRIALLFVSTMRFWGAR